jgi:hypothetical protein
MRGTNEDDSQHLGGDIGRRQRNQAGELDPRRERLFGSKQFCSLNGGDPLIGEAIARAQAVASRSCICVVVAEEHRDHWRDSQLGLPDRSVIVQPCNRGTAVGVLLAALDIEERDPNAIIHARSSKCGQAHLNLASRTPATG